MAVITGDALPNDLVGTDFADVISGRTGKDRIWGKKGADIIDGGKDDDRLWGDEGEDDISGSLDRDWIRGGRDNDTLYGDRKYWDNTMSLDGRWVLQDENPAYRNSKSRHRDVFYFEKDAGENGVDIIKDFDVITQGGLDVYGANKSDSDARFDTLDLTEALGRQRITYSNISSFVKVELLGGVATLWVDRDGALGGQNFQKFATITKFMPFSGSSPAPDGSDFFKPLSVGDQLFVRSSTYSGFISVMQGQV